MAIKLNPVFAEAYNNLGSIYQGEGNYNKAKTNYLKAIGINSKFYQAYQNIGEIYIINKEFSLAEESFKNAEKIKPLSAKNYNMLGNMFYLIKNYSEAIKNYKKSINIELNNPEPYYNLGVISEKLHELKKSSTYYIKALKLKPNFHQALSNYGNILNQINKSKEAIPYFMKAISIDPKFAEAHNNLGNVYNNLGKFSEAEKYFNKAIELNPKYYEAYRNLSLIKEFKKKDPIFKIIINMLKNTFLSDEDKIQLNFTLGKAFEDIKDYKNSFFYFSEGNRLKKKETDFNIKKDEELFLNIEQSFRNNKINLNLEKQDFSKIPIFVMGMPRSGTTLVEQILSSHSKIAGAGELGFLNSNINDIDWPLESLKKKDLKKVRDGYFLNVNDLQLKKNFFIDKMPLNFRWIGFIKKSIPEAKIIHLSRDPRAVCFSIFKCYFSTSGNSYAYDLKDIIDYFNIYINLMRFYKKKYPDFIFDINYEKLTTNQKEETVKMLDYIGLEWDEKCIKFYQNDKSVMTASSVQVRKGLYQGSSEKWKNYSKYMNSVFDKLKLS